MFMSSYGDAYSFLKIPHEGMSDKEYDSVFRQLNIYSNAYTLFESRKDDKDIDLWLQSSEMYGDFNETLEEFYAWLLKEFGVRLQGYIIEEIEGTRYRGEFNEDGKLEFVDYDWLNVFTNAELRELKKMAQEKFGKPKDLWK